MGEDKRSIKSVEFYKNGNVKRIEFYEPAQAAQPHFVSSVFGSPQWTAKTYEATSGASHSHTTVASTDQLCQSVEFEFVSLPASSCFRDLLFSIEEDEAWREDEV